jgi:hypothetical protein
MSSDIGIYTRDTIESRAEAMLSIIDHQTIYASLTQRQLWE